MIGILPGDIGFVHGEKFIARSIQYFMKEYCEKMGWPVPDPLWNHTFHAILLDNEIRIAEMVIFDKFKIGLKIRPWEKTDYVNKKYGSDYIIRRPRFEVTDEMIRKLSSKTIDYSCENLRYDIGNIFQQIIKSYTGIWIGKKGLAAELVQVCTELTATCWDYAYSLLFSNPHEANPMDLFFNKKFATLNKLEGSL
jgi:hypothetical protein